MWVGEAEAQVQRMSRAGWMWDGSAAGKEGGRVEAGRVDADADVMTVELGGAKEEVEVEVVVVVEGSQIETEGLRRVNPGGRLILPALALTLGLDVDMFVCHLMVSFCEC